MRFLIAGVVVFMGAAVAAAQVAPLPPPPDGPPLTGAEIVLSPNGVVNQHTFGAQLQFGYPNGLRLQYAAFRTGETAFLAEVFGGARDGFWGDEAVFGIGGRALFTVSSDGDNDALLFGPGLSLMYWQAEKATYTSGWGWGNFGSYPYEPETDRYYLTVDANFGWLHNFTPTVGWEIGLNLGAQIGLSGQERGGRKVSGRVADGTIGLYTGLRF